MKTSHGTDWVERMKGGWPGAAQVKTTLPQNQRGSAGQCYQGRRAHWEIVGVAILTEGHTRLQYNVITKSSLEWENT